MIILIGRSSVCLYYCACSLFQRTDKCISSLALLYRLICGFLKKPQSWKSSVPLFGAHVDGRLRRLVPQSGDIVEAADGKDPRRKILLRLAGSWILIGIVEIKQRERGVPARLLEMSGDGTLTPAIVSVLRCGDHTENGVKCLLKWKSAVSHLVKLKTL